MSAGVRVWKVGGGRLGGDGLWDLQDMWAGVREGYSWCSVAALGTRLGDWI